MKKILAIAAIALGCSLSTVVVFGADSWATQSVIAGLLGLAIMCSFNTWQDYAGDGRKRVVPNQWGLLIVNLMFLLVVGNYITRAEMLLPFADRLLLYGAFLMCILFMIRVAHDLIVYRRR